MLQELIDELDRTVCEFGGHVERMLVKSIRGLADGDGDALMDIILKDEPKANEYETDLDELCTDCIARFQPKAGNLRNVLMVLKMNSDLERIGDHAANIAGSALHLIKSPPTAPYDKIPPMAEIVMGMLNDSLSAFSGRDVQLAERVNGRDARVNALRDGILAALIANLRQDHANIEYCLHVQRVSGNLERIADLSKNICEDVIFLVSGQVTKHHHSADKDGAGQDPGAG